MLGTAHTSLRDGIGRLREEEGRSQNETRGHQRESQGTARENYSDSGGRACGDLGNGGRPRARSFNFLYDHQEDERCHEHSYGNSARHSRDNVPQKEGSECATVNYGTFQTDSPSIGHTIFTPPLGEWAWPSFHPLRQDLHPSVVVACDYWEAMKPRTVHSVLLEEDFKSELEARRQGFLLEQSLVQTHFVDDLQRFEFAEHHLDTARHLNATCVATMCQDGLQQDYEVEENTYFLSNDIENICDHSAGVHQRKCEIGTKTFDSEHGKIERNCHSGPRRELHQPVRTQDLETLCAELALDLDELQESIPNATRPDTHLFYIYAASDLGSEAVIYTLELSWPACGNVSTWQALMGQLLTSQEWQGHRLFRAFSGEVEKLAGVHHLLLVPWQVAEVPALLQVLSPEGQQAYLFDATKTETVCTIPLTNAMLCLDKHRLWQMGHRLDHADPPIQQCGFHLLAIAPSVGPVQARIDEDDIAEEPRFDIGVDEEVVLPEDVQGRDEVIVFIRDDEDLILQSIAAFARDGTIHLVMFGYDGTPLGRRDADATPADFDSVQRAIERSWQDYEGHFVKPYLVQPQPEPLTREGLVFVVAIQHVFAAAPIPSMGHILGLAGIQLSYAGSTEPDIHRAVELEERTCSADVKASLQLTRLCKPFGRRHCDVYVGGTLAEDEESYPGQMGSYIKVDIQEERVDFDIRRACRAYESLEQDIRTAMQDERIHQIRLVQHGHRYRSLGTVNQMWDTTMPVDDVSIAQHFAQGWLTQPLDRMQIFRVHALDAVEPTHGVLELHTIVTFDLVPGHTVCLAMPNTVSLAWTLSGPHLLQPEFWDVNGLEPDVPNPIRSAGYEYLLYPGRVPTLTAVNGDVIVYAETRDENEHGAEQEPDVADDFTLLQLHHNQQLLPDRDFAIAHPTVKPCPAYELPGHTQRAGRTLELFPLLWGHCDEVLLPHTGVEIERFMQACKHFRLQRELPAVFDNHLKPITRAYLETCVAELDEDETELHIYTDGSSFLDKSDGIAERDGTWSAVVFKVSGKKRSFLGWVAGFVIDEPANKRFIGAPSKNALHAERSGIFWIMTWTLGLPPGQRVRLYVDNQAACFGASGQWTFDIADDLACRTRDLMLVVSERRKVDAQHVKSHSAQPQNEFADAITHAVAEDPSCVAFKNAETDHRIASFSGYQSMWFRMVSYGLLPPVHNDRMVLLPVEEDRSFVPKLSRKQDVQWKSTKMPHPAHLDLFVSTYNVLSLRHCDPTGELDSDSIFPGKTKYLAQQMLEQKLHLMMLQECRCNKNGIFENKDLIRVVSAGLSDGTLGTEIWMNKQLSLGNNGRTKLHFAKNQLFVIHASPRLLVLKIKLPDKNMVVISGHCPHSMDTHEHRQQWWEQLTHIMSKLSEADLLICGCDFNARLPASVPPHVGDLVCEKGNSNTHFLLEYVKRHHMILPSTFAELHNGPSATWRHSTGKVARLDYLATKIGQWDSLSSTAWPHLDAGNAIPDHSSTGLRLRTSWMSKTCRSSQVPIDWEQVRDVENRDAVRHPVSNIPVAPWHTMPSKQVENLHEQVYSALRKHFPLKKSRPRKPYISEPTWELRSKRKNILAALRVLHVAERQGDLRYAFGKWSSSSQAQTCERWALVAIQPLVEKLLLGHLRDDKAAFITNVAKTARDANGTEVFKALAPFRVGSRFTKRGVEPLPLWRKEDGEPAMSYQERLDIWRKQCSDLEAGELTNSNELMCHAIDRAAARRENVPPVQFADLPSVIELEDRLRKIRRNKTAGNDGLRSDVFAIAAPQFARHLFSVAAKLAVTLQEPIQSKGGTLVAAYKGSGAADAVSNYRSLLLSSHFGKALRSFWRQKTVPLYSSSSSALHFAGKLGGNVSHASMLLQSLLTGASRRNHSSCAIFLDIKAAYYRVIREFVVNMTTSNLQQSWGAEVSKRERDYRKE